MAKAFAITARNDIGRERWDAFADLSDEAWLWHRFDLQDAIATWPSRYDCSFALQDGHSKDMLAIVPAQLIKRNFGKMLCWSYLNSLGGAACHNSLDVKERHGILGCVYQELIKIANQNNVMEINISLSPMAPVFRGEHCPTSNPLLRFGCQNTLTQTWVVNIGVGKDELWRGVKESARSNIRKAEKSNVRVRTATQPNDLNAYYNLHCETYNRTGVRPHPKAYFQAIWSYFLAKGLAHIIVAEHEGEIVSAANFAVYKNAALFWTGASSNKGLSMGASSLLNWTAMKWMGDNGIDWYETGEAFPNARAGKTKGLNDFKKSFGGSLYPYYKGQIITNKALHGIIVFLSSVIHNEFL